MEKWVVRCAGCQIAGYRPEMPVSAPEDGFAQPSDYIAYYFKPLVLSERNLCEQCEDSDSN